MAESCSPCTPEKREPKWRARFLEALAATGNAALAARAAGVKRRTAYWHKARFPKFAAAWDEAVDESTDVLEAEARRRAVKGTDKPVYYKGEVVGAVKEYSDTLLIFLLKANRPEKFRDGFDLRRYLESYESARSSHAASAAGRATGHRAARDDDSGGGALGG